MTRFSLLAIAALSTWAVSSVYADICGTDKSGQAIDCQGGICCPSSKTGSWTCAPPGSTCCYGANRADALGLYCAYGTMCYDSENCADDKMSTFPATPGSSGKATATTLSADKTVYDGPVPTTPAAGDGGSGAITGTGTPAGVTATGTGAPGSTHTGKSNGTRGRYFDTGAAQAAIAAASLWAFWVGITV